MKLWIWCGLRFELPDDWEMLQFSKNPRIGRCLFADRYQNRMEINWREVEGPPDFERMLSDYRSKLANDEDMRDIKEIETAGWPGLQGYVSGNLSSRFGRYMRSRNIILEVVFLWPEKADVFLIREVLSSIGEYSDDGNIQRWRAFGLDIMTDAELELKKCRVEPANVEMVFMDRKELCTETYARRGMLNVWLGGTVKEWLADQVPARTSGKSEHQATVSEHVVEHVEGMRKRRGLGGMFGRKMKFDGLAWICPEDNRLYSALLTRKPSADEGPGRLRCCSAMENQVVQGK